MDRIWHRYLAKIILFSMFAVTISCSSNRNSEGLASLYATSDGQQTSLLGDAKNIVDLKMRILKTIRYPAASFAFVLGYTYATGTGATGQDMGEDMSIVNDPANAEPTGWQGNYRSSDPAAKGNTANQRLKVTLFNWNMQAQDLTFTGDPTRKTLSPVTIDSIEVTNDADQDVTQTYRISKTVSTTYTYTQNNQFNWSSGVSTSFNTDVPLIAGGSVKLSLDFGGSVAFGSQQQIVDSTLKDASIQIPVPAHSTVSVDIIVNKQSVSIPYKANVKIIADLKYDGILRYGDPGNPKSRNFNEQYRDSGSPGVYEATFGSVSRPFYEDLANQCVNGGSLWMWDDMWAVWGDEGKSHLHSLTDPNNFILPLTGVLTYEDGLSVSYKIRSSHGSSNMTSTVANSQ